MTTESNANPPEKNFVITPKKSQLTMEVSASGIEKRKSQEDEHSLMAQKK